MVKLKLVKTCKEFTSFILSNHSKKRNQVGKSPDQTNFHHQHQSPPLPHGSHYWGPSLVPTRSRRCGLNFKDDENYYNKTFRNSCCCSVCENNTTATFQENPDTTPGTACCSAIGNFQGGDGLVICPLWENDRDSMSNDGDDDSDYVDEDGETEETEETETGICLSENLSDTGFEDLQSTPKAKNAISSQSSTPTKSSRGSFLRKQAPRTLTTITLGSLNSPDLIRTMKHSSDSSLSFVDEENSTSDCKTLVSKERWANLYMIKNVPFFNNKSFESAQPFPTIEEPSSSNSPPVSPPLSPKIEAHPSVRLEGNAVHIGKPQQLKRMKSTQDLRAGAQKISESRQEASCPYSRKRKTGMWGGERLDALSFLKTGSNHAILKLKISISSLQSAKNGTFFSSNGVPSPLMTSNFVELLDYDRDRVHTIQLSGEDEEELMDFKRSQLQDGSDNGRHKDFQQDLSSISSIVSSVDLLSISNYNNNLDNDSHLANRQEGANGGLIRAPKTVRFNDPIAFVSSLPSSSSSQHYSSSSTSSSTISASLNQREGEEEGLDSFDDWIVSSKAPFSNHLNSPPSKTSSSSSSTTNTTSTAAKTMMAMVMNHSHLKPAKISNSNNSSFKNFTNSFSSNNNHKRGGILSSFKRRSGISITLEPKPNC